LKDDAVLAILAATSCFLFRGTTQHNGTRTHQAAPWQVPEQNRDGVNRVHRTSWWGKRTRHCAHVTSAASSSCAGPAVWAGLGGGCAIVTDYVEPTEQQARLVLKVSQNHKTRPDAIEKIGTIASIARA
jgi:hypothetical protein